MLKKYFHRNLDPTEGGLHSAAVSVLQMEDSPETDVTVMPTYLQEEDWKDVQLGKNLDEEKHQAMKELLQHYPDVLTDVPGRTNLVTYKIEMSNPEVIRTKPYPVPYNLQTEVDKEINNMLAAGVIENSNSSYSSPILVVPKKDGKYRLCLDFRKLNKLVKFDAEPMGDPESIFAKLGESKYFSKIDLTKGYWQVALEEGSKKYTAFSTPSGLYQFTVLPFGLATAPAVFNRLIRKVFAGMENVETFLDDILIHSKTWKEHCQTVNVVLDKLRQAGLTARPSKCEIGKTNLEYLGHVVGEGKLKPISDKVKDILAIPTPTTKKEVRSFLGLSGYYRRYIPDYATIAAPLTDLTRKNSPNRVEWMAEHQHSFEVLKRSLSTAPVLKLVDHSKPFILRTDASGVGLGAVLLQERDDEKWPVAYASRKLTTAEKRYSVVERECLAVVWAVKKFYQFLYGREFTLETDHRPLTYLDSATALNQRLMRWALKLQEFRFTKRYIKGIENVGADLLSRLVE